MLDAIPPKNPLPQKRIWTTIPKVLIGFLHLGAQCTKLLNQVENYKKTFFPYVSGAHNVPNYYIRK